MVKMNAIVGFLVLVCCAQLAHASHKSNSHKPGATAVAKHSIPPARPPRPNAHLGSNSASAAPADVAISIGSSAGSGKDAKHMHGSAAAKAAATGATAGLQYQQADRETPISGRAKSPSAATNVPRLANLSDLQDGDDGDSNKDSGSGADDRSPLLSNSQSSQSNNDIAQTLAAKFPGIFPSVKDIEKHVEDLAEHNPLVLQTMANHVSALATANSTPSTRGRKGSSKTKATSVVSSAESFLSAQMMAFLKKDRDTHAANATAQTEKTDKWKKISMGSGVTGLVSLLFYAFTEYTKATSCK